MWYNTDITKIAGIQYPILQGPFGGGLSSPKLVAAVSNAGGLGGYGAYQLQPEEIKTIDTEIKSKTNKPYNINLWVNDADKKSSHYTKEEFNKVAAIYKPFFDELNIPLPQQPQNILSKFEKQVEIIFECKPPVFSFVFGIPDEYILKECRRLGIKTIGAATTLDEAIALEDARVDMIVATGFEAGGHRPSFLRSAEDSLTGIYVLIQQLTKYIHTPIIAAGGIADASGIKTMLSSGASGVQIGTAFLACEESGATDEYRNIIFSERAKYTTLTKSFTGRLGRGTTGIVSEKMKGLQTLPFPLQTTFMSPLRKAASEQGRTDMITYWMGQAASLAKHKKAGELMDSLIEDMKTEI